MNIIASKVAGHHRRSRADRGGGSRAVGTVERTVLPCQRALFELEAGVTYLNSANLSPQLRSVAQAGAVAVRRRSAPWTIAARDWFAGPEALRELAARLMGASPEGVALVPAVSYGVAVAATNIPIRKGQNVVLLADQFPSNVYAWRLRATEVGGHVRTARRDPAGAWTDAVLDAVDPDTAVVAVPNCHWTDGALVDLVAVGARARAVGAALVVDASQSFGALPLDVGAVQPDFLVSVGYKWQLGPYGLAYLYVSPRWRESGRPLEASWLTRAGAEDFANLVRYTDALRSGARRFDMGGYPQFVLGPMAAAALAQLQAWSVERVAATLRRLTDVVAAEAEAMGCAVLPTEHRVGHMLGVRRAGGLPPGLADGLRRSRVFVSVRGDAIRVAPHMHNEEADVRRFLSVLRRSLH